MEEGGDERTRILDRCKLVNKVLALTTVSAETVRVQTLPRFQGSGQAGGHVHRGSRCRGDAEAMHLPGGKGHEGNTDVKSR